MPLSAPRRTSATAPTTESGFPRGRHRAPAAPRRSLVTLPSAAAAVITLTAAGVVVAGSAFTPSTATADTSAIARIAEPALTADLAGDNREVAGVRAAVRDAREAAAYAEKVAAKRAEARARASRAAARAKLLAAAEAKAKAEAQREKELAEQAHEWQLPVLSYRFTSPFGMRWGSLHAGNDFAAPVGTPAYAMSSGTVIFAGTQSGYGTKLEIRYWDGTVSWYGHMSEITVGVGEKVASGERVGSTGNTGHSTGPHLHLEIHPDGGGPIDPRPWLADRGLDV